MHRTLRLRSLALLGGFALAAAACSDGGGGTGNTEPEPAVLEIVEGQDQQAATSSAVATPPRVRVLDDAGEPVANVSVTFQVMSGGGTITGGTPKTNSSGEAAVGSWTLGPTAGANTLRASVTGLQAQTFTATGVTQTTTAADVALHLGGGQTAQVGTPVELPPSVRVTDAEGQPVQFATVVFTVQGGGGSVTGGTQATDANGIARVGEWKLGPTAGVNTLRATVTGVAPLDITATGAAIDNGGYNLTLRFISDVTPEQLAAFEAARDRWEEVITGELSDINITPAQELCPASYGTPAVSGVIDDVVIFVKLVPIDGPGKVLGSAGPCAIRTSNGLPISGVMNFDTADLAAMGTNLFREVILHEMGHVLGIGSLWNTTNPARTLLTGEGGDDPYFTGLGAIAAFDGAGGTAYAGNKVPVENTGGDGTRDSHWREATFGLELMTGFISANNANPLSAMTIASLADMGYVVNAAVADPYTWTSSVRLNAGQVLMPMIEAPLTEPIMVFSESGRLERTVPRR